MKNSLLAVFAVAALVVGGLLYSRVQQQNRLTDEVTRLEAEIAAQTKIGATPDRSAAEIAKLTARIAELETALAAAEAAKAGTEGGEAMAAKDAAAEPEEKKKEPSVGMNIAKMFEDPGMRAMIEQQQRMQIEGSYRGLVDELGLDETTGEGLIDLLVKKMMGAATTGMKFMDGTLSEAERNELVKEIQENTKAVDSEIRALLDEDAYASFELFEKSQPERQAIQMHKGTLTGDLALSQQQEEDLMTVMYDTRTSFKKSTPDFGKENSDDPDVYAMFNAEKVEVYISEYEQMQQAIAEKAQPILSAEQYEAFVKSQKGLVEMQKQMMKMSLSMWQPGGE